MNSLSIFKITCMRKLSLFLVIIFFLISNNRVYSKPLSEYSLNIYNPLVLNGSRCTGMAGAVVSLGDNSDDIFYNPAASSVRNKWQKDNFEWDYSIFFANVFTKDDIDYRNAREVIPNYESDSQKYISIALMILYKRWSWSLSLFQH